MGEISANNLHQIIFPGVVLDYNDPMMLGRIRARPEKQIDYEAAKKANNFNEDKDKWKSNDPFIFLPLLPYYCYFVPKDKDEYVHLIYQNKSFKFQNQFYIPGLLSSPMNLKGEHYLPAMKYLASGDIFKASIAIKDTNNNYIEAVSKGVFPEPGDNAILGRGTTDLVLKPDEVLIRAGKTNLLAQNQFPTANTKQAFIQLSNFTQKVVNLPKETEIIQEFPVIGVKRMIVWHIQNLESLINFTGYVKLYDIIPNSELINSKNFTIETIGKLGIGNDYKETGIGETFIGKSFDDTIVQINKFIDNVFNNTIQTSGNTSTSGFPIVVTPSEQTYQKGNLFQITGPDDLAELNNYVNFFSKISINKGVNKSGFFLISDNNNGSPVIGIPPRLTFIESTPQEITSDPITYGVVGAQKLYLLSHDSKGPNGKIDLGTSIYGLEQNLFTKPEQNIELQTYPTVRGDQLILLLRKMMAFITGHVHPTATLPPIPVSAGNGQTSVEIEVILSNAENDILNQNIRIN